MSAEKLTHSTEPRTLEKDGFEEVELSLTKPYLLFPGLVREYLRPSTTINGFGVFLILDPERANLWKGTISDPASRETQSFFFKDAGYTQLQTQFPRHVIAARTIPQKN